MDQSIDQLMDEASLALAHLDYLECERLCLEALSVARQEANWPDYARILLPLQEVRRQRRLIAADGEVRLGSARLTGEPVQWLVDHAPFCLALTRPHTAEDARDLQKRALQQRRYVEILLADNQPDAPVWRLRSFDGPNVQCEIDAPATPWIEQWLEQPTVSPPDAASPRAADWFIDATEALGDAAAASVDPDADPVDRLAQLEQCLAVVTDHEKLHQQLWRVAHQLAAAD